MRTNNSDINLAILFELTATAVNSITDQTEECVIGWGLLPMFTGGEGEKIEKKTYQIMLHNGNALQAGRIAQQLDTKHSIKKGLFQSV